MSQFQIIASVIMLIIIFISLAPKIFAQKNDRTEGLSPEEKAYLFPETNDSEFEHSDYSPTESGDAEFEQTMPFDVTEAIKTGQKLLAVKLYRQQFGTSLKESVAAVESSTVYREQFAINMKK